MTELWRDADAEITALGTPYTRLFFALCIVMIFNFMFNAMLQGAGDMKTPLAIMAFINIIHLFFNYVFIYGMGPFPELGVTGAALGTMTARFVGAMLGLGVLFSGRFAVKLAWGTSFRPDWDLIRRLLRIGVPVAIQNTVRTLANLGFLWVVTNSAAAGVGRQAKGPAVHPREWEPDRGGPGLWISLPCPWRNRGPSSSTGSWRPVRPATRPM